MADIYKITEVISKVMEILSSIAAVALIVMAVVFFVADNPEDLIADESMISACGMVIYTGGLPAEDAAYVMGATAIVASIMFALVTMMFRNVNLIVRTARGGTWFSKGATPFQDDNIRMIREIGIFFIALYPLELIGSAVAQAISSGVETSTTLMPLIIGIILICLSKMFEYGKELQETEDGLI